MSEGPTVVPTGISIFRIAVGAILYFAVTRVVDGLNLGAVGAILMIVGPLGLAVSLGMLGMTCARVHVQRITVVQRHEHRAQRDARAGWGDALKHHVPI